MCCHATVHQMPYRSPSSYVIVPPTQEDDLSDIRNKYNAYLRNASDRPAPLTQQRVEYANYSQRQGGWMQNTWGTGLDDMMYDDRHDHWDDDDDEDLLSTQPKETEMRFLNGKHILTNQEIT